MTVSTSPSKHTVHSLLLLPTSSGGEDTGDTGGLSGELGAVTAERENRQTSTHGSQVGSAGQPHEGRASVPEPMGGNSGRHGVQFFFWVLPLFLCSYPPAASMVVTLWNATSRCFSSLQERMRGLGQGQPISLHPRGSTRPYPGMTQMPRRTG